MCVYIYIYTYIYIYIERERERPSIRLCNGNYPPGNVLGVGMFRGFFRV